MTSAANLRQAMPQIPPAKGGVPVTAPVEPKTEMVKISAEDLVKASLPWQGMDSPERDAAYGCVGAARGGSLLHGLTARRGPRLHQAAHGAGV